MSNEMPGSRILIRSRRKKQEQKAIGVEVQQQ